MAKDKRTLAAIAEWLDSDTPPSAEVAEVLFHDTIPAALDVEVALLHERSVKLLQKAHKLAGLPQEALSGAAAAVTGVETVPASCAVCGDAKHAYSMGAYELRCMFQKEGEQEERKPRVLAFIPPDRAFYQPADVSRAQLIAEVANQPPPSFCPRRG